MAQHTKAKRIEKRAIGILTDLLNKSALRTEITAGDDDAPLIDGYVHLLAGNDHVSGHMLKIQLKPLKINKKSLPSITCSVDLLLHAKESSVPVLLVGVDVDTRTVNWIYLAPEFSAHIHEKQLAKARKTATLKAPTRNAITPDGDSYLADWKRICLFHRNASNDRIVARFSRRIKENSFVDESAWLERVKALGDLQSYRTNFGSYPIVDVVLEIGPSILHKPEAVKVAFLDLLETTAYDETAQTLSLLSDFGADSSETVRKRAVDLLKKISRYDYHVLNTFGFRPYREQLDFVRAAALSDEVALAVLGSLLNPDFDGSEQTERHAIKMLRGPLIPSPQLEAIRRDVIEFLANRFTNAHSISERLAIIETLNAATRKSAHLYEVDETLSKRSVAMVAADTKLIVEIFERILFDGDKFVSDWPVAYEIEVALAWLDARLDKVGGVADVLSRLRDTQGDYKLYRSLVGEVVRLRLSDDISKAQDIVAEQTRVLLADINDENADEHFARLSAIAAFNGPVKSWRFQRLAELLFSLGTEQPQIAATFAQKALIGRTGLFDFIDSLLIGLRRGSRQLWYQVAQHIEDDRLESRVGGILLSLLPARQDEERLPFDADDVRIVCDIAHRRDRFAFLANGQDDHVLEYHAFRVLLFMSARQPLLKEILMQKIENEFRLAPMFCHEIYFALFQKWIDLNDWTAAERRALAGLLTRTPTLGYDESRILHSLGMTDFATMMEVFYQRISGTFPAEYEAIPYEIDHQLCDFVRANTGTISIIQSWLAELPFEEDSSVAFRIGYFLHKIGGSLLNDVISALLESGIDDEVLRALKLLPYHTPIDLSLGLKFVAASQSGLVWETIAIRLQDYGFGSGHPDENITARELQRICANISHAREESLDENVNRFCDQLLETITTRILNSEKDHAKRLAAERAAFELDRLE